MLLLSSLKRRFTTKGGVQKSVLFLFFLCFFKKIFINGGQDGGLGRVKLAPRRGWSASQRQGYQSDRCALGSQGSKELGGGRGSQKRESSYLSPARFWCPPL